VAHARLPHVRPDVIGDALYHERHENLVCVRDIEIYSLCEHHLLPFFARRTWRTCRTAGWWGYQDPARDRGVRPPAAGAGAPHRPGGDALMDVLDPRGVGVVIEATTSA